MKQFELLTGRQSLNNTDWVTIKHHIMNLPYFNDKFLVLSSLDKDHSFIQTVINTEDYRTQGLYCLEVRMPVDKGFRHYQATTNDSVQIISDFRQFYENEFVDVSNYDDITNEFNK